MGHQSVDGSWLPDLFDWVREEGKGIFYDFILRSLYLKDVMLCFDFFFYLNPIWLILLNNYF